MKKTLASFSCFNPRREAFDVTDASQDRVQIPWEFRMLRFAHFNLFYFSLETFAPISMWELGAALERSVTSGERNIYVALHPEYKRRNDVIIQTETIRADSQIGRAQRLNSSHITISYAVFCLKKKKKKKRKKIKKKYTRNKEQKKE